MNEKDQEIVEENIRSRESAFVHHPIVEVLDELHIGLLEREIDVDEVTVVIRGATRKQLLAWGSNLRIAGINVRLENEPRDMQLPKEIWDDEANK